MATLAAWWAAAKLKVIAWAAVVTAGAVALLMAYRKGKSESEEQLERAVNNENLAQQAAQNTKKTLETVKDLNEHVRTLPAAADAPSQPHDATKPQDGEAAAPQRVGSSNPASAAGRLSTFARED